MIRAQRTQKTGRKFSRERFQKRYDQAVTLTGQRVATSMQSFVKQTVRTPGAVARPIEWTSDEQRIAVMIKLRKAGNLPYRRSNKVIRGWQLLWQPGESGGKFMLTNRVPYSRFVFGLLRPGNTFQQRFHRNTGWQTAVEIRDAVLGEARERLAKEHRQVLGVYDLFQ